ncbi:MAG: helix-turn-helix domain-containing protein [Ignavibacteriaceae bacterium]|nr:helix-turn-helix domain-containing protein [Ignavibacteriaceae bacterium]
MAVHYIQISNPNDFAKIIQFYRKKSGLSREKLGMLSGVGRTAIFDIEHGKTTYQIDTLLKIMDVLNLKLYIDGLFNRELK